MKAPKIAALIASVYLVLALALIIFEYREFIHPPGDGRWIGMLSFLATMPTSFAVNALAVQTGGARPGESPDAFLSTMSIAAVLNAVALFVLFFVLIKASARPRPE